MARKIHLTAKDISELLGVSEAYSYKLIRKMNSELEKEGYLVIAGRIPTRYFEEKWYGFEVREGGYEGSER